MTCKDIKLWPDPCLSQLCQSVDPQDASLPDLIADLFDTMYAAPGRGLAAPQIGVLKRVFVVDVDWKDAEPSPIAFVNPVITSSSIERSVASEQCLSIPALPMAVERPDSIELSWTGTDGRPQSGLFSGNLARCIQHEFDHLEGKVIFDHQSSDLRAKLEADYAA